MQQNELVKELSALKAQCAAMRRDLKTAFRRIEEQTQLTHTVHQLALSIRDLANKQDTTCRDVNRLSKDVEELKGRSGKRWDTVILELIKYLVLAAAGYFTAKLM